MSKLRVALFSGGSGTASIAKAFLDSGASLDIIVNCYDDGKSTGILRHQIPGMLGPSDVRKNVARFSLVPDTLERRGLVLMTPEVVALLGVIDKVYPDCPYGNLAFAGMYLKCEQQFNRTVTEFCGRYIAESLDVRVYNVTDGTSLWLRADRADGTSSDESEISTAAAHGPVLRLSLTGVPRPNPEVIDILSKADLIVYGPGTQYSSLLPSYMTLTVAQAIECNRRAAKVYIANACRDWDTPESTVSSLLNDLVTYMNVGSSYFIPLESLVHTALVAGALPEGDVQCRALMVAGSVCGRVHNGPATVQAILGLLPPR